MRSVAAAVKRVKDEDYWHKPVGTPITRGTRAKKPDIAPAGTTFTGTVPHGGLERIRTDARPPRDGATPNVSDLNLAPDDDPGRYARGESERTFLSELRDDHGFRLDYVTVKGDSRKNPDFASRVMDDTLELKEPDAEPADERALQNSMRHNLSRGSTQSRNVVVDYRQFPSVTTERLREAFPQVIDRPTWVRTWMRQLS